MSLCSLECNILHSRCVFIYCYWWFLYCLYIKPSLPLIMHLVLIQFYFTWNQEPFFFSHFPSFRYTSYFHIYLMLMLTPWKERRELDYKESWVPKTWCFWTVVLEKTLESPLDCKEIQPVHPKGDQSWVFTGRADVEAETPIFWLPDVKNWFTWKDPDAGKDWKPEEKGMTENELVGWHHRLNGHDFE